MISAAAVSATVLSRSAGQAAAEVRTAQGARTYNFNSGWLFGGVYTSGSEQPRHDDRGYTRVCIPHTVTHLSWGDWDPRDWQNVWIYRKHFHRPGLASGRVLLKFDGVMTSATVVLNGAVVSAHQGGYLPWTTELTHHLTAGDNVLAVIVDARWQHVPPGGSLGGAGSVDYMMPGGICRDATLMVVPQVFLSDVFVKPVDVLSSGRSVDVLAAIDAAVPAGQVRVTSELLDGTRVLGTATATARVPAHSKAHVRLRIGGIGGVSLWSPESPKLYKVRTTVSHTGGPAHTTEVRTGFRTAVFYRDGFRLNGQPYKLFGLNRHQLYPYLGMAAAARLQRRDAELLRTELNCNMVRCSHYPQSPHFLNACDELGLMVWQETPGWGYVGDHAYQDLVVQNVRDMVIRDRSRPSVIVWGTRLNETPGHAHLFARTRRKAHHLDGSRQTAGATNYHALRNWGEDVFGYDDYHHHNNKGTLRPPLESVPYFVSEAVGSLDGPPTFRWTDPSRLLARQAIMHAEAHAIARSNNHYAGLLGWSAFDYASLNEAGRRGKVWHSLKTPGVMDTFRVAKPGAAFYRSQVDPRTRPVILPVFWWDFGPGSPQHGPGPDAMVATNCDRLEFFVDGKHHSTARQSQHLHFGHLAHPPVFANLTVHGPSRPSLRIDGFVGGQKVASVQMSADPGHDRLALTADDTSLEADGSDATRVTFRAVDAYGHHRPHLTGSVQLFISGPGTLIGDNPFPFGSYGGVGGAFVRTQAGVAGTVTVTAHHPTLGRTSVRIRVKHPPGRRFL
ncbi:MAG: glycoside hydrolase family 2 TIM barrel-domain containing protein [Actinomycetota bacterium]